jgi:hypothetical protein
LPRQPGGSASISKEATWLPVLGPRLPVSVPDVVAVFEPDRDFPERWSVVRWIEGERPWVVDRGTSVDPRREGLARDLAAVLEALQQAEVPTRPACGRSSSAATAASAQAWPAHPTTAACWNCQSSRPAVLPTPRCASQPAATRRGSRSVPHEAKRPARRAPHTKETTHRWAQPDTTTGNPQSPTPHGIRSVSHNPDYEQERRRPDQLRLKSRSNAPNCWTGRFSGAHNSAK